MELLRTLISSSMALAQEATSPLSNIAEECGAITAYSAQMNQRAQTMQRSAQDSADAASAKAEELLQSLNDAIEKSRSVDQIKNLTVVCRRHLLCTDCRTGQRPGTR